MTTTPKTLVALTSPSQAAKAILYISLTVAAIFLQVPGGHLTLPIILAMTVAALGAIPVYFATGTVPKTVIAFGVALLQGLISIGGTALTLGSLASFPAQTWVGLVVSALAAIGIAIVPNKPLIDARDTNVITGLSPEAATALAGALKS